MHLQVSPDAPAIIKAAAESLLVLHIGGAATGLVCGGVAMVARKGGQLHRAAGNVFFAAMLAMSGVGAAVAPFLPSDQVPNTAMGLFTVYLVATAWATVRRRPGAVGRFEVGAAGLALAAASASFAFGLVNAASPHPLPQPQGTVLYVFAVVAAVAAVSDVGVILRGGLAGAARTARHLWRMSTALLIAAASFAGQPKAIPRFLHGSPILMLPMLATLALLIYWMIRVRIAPAIRRARTASPLLPRSAHIA